MTAIALETHRKSVAEVLHELGDISPHRIHMPMGTATEQDVIDALEAADKRLFELVDGVLVEKTMGIRESIIASICCQQIWNYLDVNPLGLAFTADGPCRIKVGRIRFPDAGFVSWERLPGDDLPEDAILDAIPDLVIEGISKGNTPREMELKVKDYFKAGVRLAWFIYPKTQTALAYTSQSSRKEIAKDQASMEAKFFPALRCRSRDSLSKSGRAMARKRKGPSTMTKKWGLLLCLFCSTATAACADTLEERLVALAKTHKATVAIAVKNLDNSETVYINADEVLPTASLIKFPVMLETYMQFLDGKIKLSDMVTLKDADKVPGSGILTYHFSEGATFKLRDAVRLMMVYSDNTATNLVLDKIGIAATGKRMEEWGCPNTKINAKVYKGSTTSIDPERTKKYGLGSTTAREMVVLLEKLQQGKVATPETCKEMLGHMKKCDDATKLKRFLPAKIEVAHKTGSVSDVKTDAGIMYLPSGPVAICVLTAHNPDKSFAADNPANVLIGKIAKEVVDSFTGAKGKKKEPQP